mgnify:CR=1 FL=1
MTHLPVSIPSVNGSDRSAAVERRVVQRHVPLLIQSRGNAPPLRSDYITGGFERPDRGCGGGREPTVGLARESRRRDHRAHINDRPRPPGFGLVPEHSDGATIARRGGSDTSSIGRQRRERTDFRGPTGGCLGEVYFERKNHNLIDIRSPTQLKNLHNVFPPTACEPSGRICRRRRRALSSRPSAVLPKGRRD